MVATVAESSFALPSETPESSRVGASFTAVTVRATVSVVLENALVSPVVEVSAVPPEVPADRSQARRVMAGSITPFQLTVGLK